MAHIFFDCTIVYIPNDPYNTRNVVKIVSWMLIPFPNIYLNITHLMIFHLPRHLGLSSNMHGFKSLFISFVVPRSYSRGPSFVICISYHQYNFFYLKEQPYFSWLAPLLLQNTSKSYIRPEINMIPSKTIFIPLSDCLWTLEALLCCRIEMRLKEGWREGNVRTWRLAGRWHLQCYFG